MHGFLINPHLEQTGAPHSFLFKHIPHTDGEVLSLLTGDTGCGQRNSEFGQALKVHREPLHLTTPEKLSGKQTQTRSPVW